MTEPIVRRSHARGRVPFAAVLLAYAVLGAAQAAVEPSAELETVRDMLRLDAERALAAERGKSPAPAASQASAPPRADRLVVSAIYGVRGRLEAVVAVNGEPKLYRQGGAWPRGSAGGPGEYRLVKIDDGCVYLAKGAAKEKAWCFTVQEDPRPAPRLAAGGVLPLSMPLAALAAQAQEGRP